MNNQIPLIKTEKGDPAICQDLSEQIIESKISQRNCTIIADENGDKIKPIYLSHNPHKLAIFIAKPNLVLCYGQYANGNITLSIVKITNIKQQKIDENQYHYFAIIERLHTYLFNKWDQEPPDKFNSLIKTTVDKLKIGKNKPVFYLPIDNNKKTTKES